MTAPLSGSLRLLLPSDSQTLLLKSALLPQDAARAALEEWQRDHETPVPAFVARPGGGRLLAPLIHHNLRESAARIRPDLLTYLRTAAVREELRAREYWRICSTTLSSLAAADVETIALQGAAVGQAVYPEAALRHSHDIDLLVRRPALKQASPAVERVGFEPDGSGVTLDGVERHQVHVSGLPLVLHTGLYLVPYYNEGQDTVWDRAEATTVSGAPALVLSPADQLLHVCAHAATGWHRDSLLWACDAWHIIRTRPELDWELVIDEAMRLRMCLPAYVTLRYLAEQLGAPIPTECRERLQTEAAAANRLQHEVALFGMWSGPGSKLGRALRASSSWRERLFIVGWRLLPSPSSTVSMGRVRSKSRWLGWYLGRPFRFVMNRLRSITAPRPAPTSSERQTANG